MFNLSIEGILFAFWCMLIRFGLASKGSKRWNVLAFPERGEVIRYAT